MNTNNQAVTRRDPMTEVVDYDLLRQASLLLASKQNREYWTSVAVPTAPNGRVRFETARQVATFAVPLGSFFAIGFFYGAVLALLAIPVLFFVGVALDRSLTAAINRQANREAQLDKGRYAFTVEVCKRCGVAPEEVTLAMLCKMGSDFLTVEAQRQVEEARRQAALTAVKAAEDARYTSSFDRSGRRQDHRHHASRRRDYRDDAPSAPSVNPANGLPMVNGAVDIHGNTFGTSNF